MSDELTPQEKEALDRLPRERMPAGLEDRVVGAMRARGLLGGRRRVIVLTNTRAAGLLAAAFAVVIGAYAIGLHSGDESGLVPPAMEEAKKNERADRQPATLEKKSRAEIADETPGAASTAVEAIVLSEGAPVEKSAEGTLAQRGRAEPETEAADRVAARPSAPTEPALKANAPAARMLASEADSPRPAGRTFLLGGIPILVDAPDSVRVTQEEAGGLILIQTTDGTIRIRRTDGR